MRKKSEKGNLFCFDIYLKRCIKMQNFRISHTATSDYLDKKMDKNGCFFRFEGYFLEAKIACQALCHRALADAVL